MNRLKLLKVNRGSYSEEKQLCEKIEVFDNALVNITEEKIEVTMNGQIVFSSSLMKFESDFLSITYRGLYPNGTPFRLVRSSEFVKNMILSQGKNDGITIASMKPDGYAIQYDIIK